MEEEIYYTHEPQEIPLKKYKKKDLIKLIKNYEYTMVDLESRINILTLAPKEIKYVIIDKEEDDKTIIYIKKRIQVIQDKHRQAIYIIELERLLAIKK